MFRFIAFCSFCLVLNVGSVSAESARHRQIALTMVDVSDQVAFTRHMIANLATLMTDAFAKQNPGRSADVQRLVAAEMDVVVGEHLEELREMLALIYVDNYTEDELNKLVAFYRTPLGRKMVNRQIDIARQAQEVAMPWGRALGQKAAERVARRLRSEGYKAEL
ncbi:MAG: DUF2059 domain-containing protein [Geminicoccaceae bacterium]